VSVIAYIYVRTKQSHHTLQTASDEPNPKLSGKITHKKKAPRKSSSPRYLFTFRSESFHALATADNTCSMKFSSFYINQNRRLGQATLVLATLLKMFHTRASLEVLKAA